MPSARFAHQSPCYGSARQENLLALHSCAQKLARLMKHDAWRLSMLSLRIYVASATPSARFARQALATATCNRKTRWHCTAAPKNHCTAAEKHCMAGFHPVAAN
jgi:hypothetical protein